MLHICCGKHLRQISQNADGVWNSARNAVAVQRQIPAMTTLPVEGTAKTTFKYACVPPCF